jgi:hypothetical protein
MRRLVDSRAEGQQLQLLSCNCRAEGACKVGCELCALQWALKSQRRPTPLSLTHAHCLRVGCRQ